MRVLYDDHGFMQRHGGVSRYFTELMKHLPDGVEYCLPFEASNNAYLQQSPFNMPPLCRSVDDFVEKWGRGHFFPLLSRLYWKCAKWLPGFKNGEYENRIRVVAALRKGDFDVFHMTGPHWVCDDWQIVAGKKPIVVTVHDLVPDILWRNRRVIACRRRVLAVASHIIAISENTKKDIVRLYGVPEEKITVIYHGYTQFESAGTGGELPVSKPYLLYVGERDGYKNFSWLVRTLAPFLKARDGLQLFCTGSPFSQGERRLLDRLGIADHVRQGFVQDGQMPVLFANAAAFICPSLYEGFGLPILDAFASGCPALLSNVASLPEVGGDAALYFDPKGDGADLVRHLELMLDESDGARAGRSVLVEKAKLRVKGFGWDACAKKTVDVYRRVS